MKSIPQQVLIAHAVGEEQLAEDLAEPLRQVGYEVAHRGTVLVGESFSNEASKVLSTGSPVVLCGTIKALGTKWARRIVTGAKQNHRARVFCVQMDEDADVETIGFDENIALYWQDPAKAIQDLVIALKKHYPLEVPKNYVPQSQDAEQRYRELALESCDIVDLANLPESDRHIATRNLELRRLYVGLRVQLELMSEEDLEDSFLEGIENRRKAKQLSLGGWDNSIDDEKSTKDNRFSIGERLGKSRRLVVLGDPGAGKTTMTRWIATAYLLRLNQDPDWKDLPDISTLPDEDWLPIIIRCRDLDAACLNGALDDILGFTLRKAEMFEHECSALRQLLPQKLRDGQALLLLDGLDEITDPTVRTKFCRQIEQICVAYPSAPIIATSRIVGYREMGYRLGRKFEHVTVADFSKEDKDDFSRRWCEITELPERREKAIEELIQDIHSTNRIERLTGNPMLLTTMALIKRKVGKLPSRRVELYEEAVKVLLNWRREVDEPLDQREAIPQLEYIAYAMCDRGIQQLREDEILELLHQMRQEYPQIHQLKNRSPEKFLKFLERRTGILVESGYVRHGGNSIPIFEFRHLTFQEYLAGRALVDGRFPNRNREFSLAEYVAPLAAKVRETSARPFQKIKQAELVVAEEWREALRLCVTSCLDDDVDAVLTAILCPRSDEEKTITRPRSVMAALCLSDEPNASEETAQVIIDSLIQQIDENDDPNNSLIFFGLSSTLTKALIELSSTRWVSILSSRLLEEFQKTISEYRWKYGGFYGIVSTSYPLQDTNVLQMLLDCSDALIHDSQCDDIDKIKAVLIIYGIVIKSSIYSDDINDFVSEKLIGRLLQMLSGSPSSSHASAKLLNLLDERSSIGQLSGIEIKDFRQLMSIVENVNPDIGTFQSICKILGRRKDNCAVEPLLAKLDDSSEDVRSSVAEALGNLGDERAVEPLLAKLDDSSEDVRVSVAEALGNLGDERAVEPLLAQLNDSNENVRGSVAEALGNLGDERAVEPLLAKLDDSSKFTQHRVIEALRKIGNERAIEPLLAQLDDPNENVRGTVAWALSNIGSEQAIELLLAKLNDSNENVRSTVAWALGNIGSEQAIEPLLAQLNDPNENVRNAISMALIRLGNKQSIKVQLDNLSSSELKIRRSALQALSQTCNDEMDRKLISRDFDSAPPFIDPRRKIDQRRLQNAANILNLSIQEVRDRYMKLADKFSLKLSFNRDQK
jgi:HEAT repeat protein/GTPase SAR1 family protein